MLSACDRDVAADAGVRVGLDLAAVDDQDLRVDRDVARGRIAAAPDGVVTALSRSTIVRRPSGHRPRAAGRDRAAAEERSPDVD